MKRIFVLPALIFGCLVGSQSKVQARLGENMVECVMRYGKPVKETKRDQYIFRKNNIFLIITFVGEQAQAIQYWKTSEGNTEKIEEFTDQEIRELLSKNSNDETCIKVGETYATKENVAVVNDSKAVTILPKKAVKAFAEKARSEAKTELEGL